jgi:translation initiation factor eIF-2B subunit gamma
VVIVTLESWKKDIHKALVDLCATMKLHFEGIPDDVDWGTADALRHVKAKLTVRLCYTLHDFI